MAKKAGKKDKHGHNFVIFSQATGQTWHHTNAYHLSALAHDENAEDLVKKFSFYQEQIGLSQTQIDEKFHHLRAGIDKGKPKLRLNPTSTNKANSLCRQLFSTAKVSVYLSQLITMYDFLLSIC